MPLYIHISISPHICIYTCIMYYATHICGLWSSQLLWKPNLTYIVEATEALVLFDTQFIASSFSEM